MSRYQVSQEVTGELLADTLAKIEYCFDILWAIDGAHMEVKVLI